MSSSGDNARGPASEIPPDEETSKALADLRGGLLASMVYALAGVLRTLRTQRNMKIHWVSGLAVMLVGMALSLDLASRASVLFCVFLVLATEVLNTALEAFVDLHIKEFRRTAMHAKDAAAGAVLIMAAGAVVVFSDVLFHSWRMILRSQEAIVRTVVLGLPLLGLVSVIVTKRLPALWLWTCSGTAVGLLSVLAWYSRDEVFSLSALALVIGALVAQLQAEAD